MGVLYKGKRLVARVLPPFALDLLFWLKSLVISNSAGTPEVIIRPEREDTVDLEELSFLAGRKVFNLSLGKLRHHGGQGFNSRQHHFVKFFKEGISALKEFYELHQPATIYEKHFIFGRLGDASSLPWLLKQNDGYQGEHGLDGSHGHSAYGPVTSEKLALEANRLYKSFRSIQRNGYLLESKFPREYNGYPRGYFLVNIKGDWVFLVVGAKHRVAALAALEWEFVPVCCEPDYPRCIFERDIETWPGVVSKEYTVEEAKLLFDSYFRSADVELW